MLQPGFKRQVIQAVLEVTLDATGNVLESTSGTRSGNPVLRPERGARRREGEPAAAAAGERRVGAPLLAPGRALMPLRSAARVLFALAAAGGGPRAVRGAGRGPRADRDHRSGRPRPTAPRCCASRAATPSSRGAVDELRKAIDDGLAFSGLFESIDRRGLPRVAGQPAASSPSRASPARTGGRSAPTRCSRASSRLQATSLRAEIRVLDVSRGCLRLLRKAYRVDARERQPPRQGDRRRRGRRLHGRARRLRHRDRLRLRSHGRQGDPPDGGGRHQRAPAPPPTRRSTPFPTGRPTGRPSSTPPTATPTARSSSC